MTWGLLFQSYSTFNRHHCWESFVGNSHAASLLAVRKAVWYCICAPTLSTEYSPYHSHSPPPTARRTTVGYVWRPQCLIQYRTLRTRPPRRPILFGLPCSQTTSTNRTLAEWKLTPQFQQQQRWRKPWLSNTHTNSRWAISLRTSKYRYFWESFSPPSLCLGYYICYRGALVRGSVPVMRRQGGSVGAIGRGVLKNVCRQVNCTKGILKAHCVGNRSRTGILNSVIIQASTL